MIKKMLDKIDPGTLYAFLLLAKALVWLVDIALDLIFGTTITKGSRQERLQARNYEHSAQRLQVLARGSWTFVQANNDSNYLKRFVSFSDCHINLKTN